MRVVEGLSIFETFEIISKSLVELGKLKMQFGQKEVIFVDSLIIYPDILEILDCSLSVAYCLFIVTEFLLANRQIY